MARQNAERAIDWAAVYVPELAVTRVCQSITS